MRSPNCVSASVEAGLVTIRFGAAIEAPPTCIDPDAADDLARNLRQAAVFARLQRAFQAAATAKGARDG